MRLPTHRYADDAAISAEVIDYLPLLVHSIVRIGVARGQRGGRRQQA